MRLDFMYPSSELDSLQIDTTPPTPSLFHYASPSESRLALNQKGTSCAVLTALISDPVFSAPALLGSVKLILAEEHAIHAIVVSIKGQIVTRANATKHFTFLDITKTLWTKSADTPAPSIPYDAAPHHQKLSGDHFWPFSISLPKEVVLPARLKHEPDVFQLPESFNERHVRASIRYSLHLRLLRPKFRADDKLQIALTFPPAACSEFFPFPRQSFFGPPSFLRGPNEDPEAWYSHRGVVPGRLNNQHPIDVKYTLSVAKPLLYARGSVIPYALAIEASDECVLHILSSPAAPVLRLRRFVKCHDGASNRLQFPAKGDAVDDSQAAIWWPAETQSPNIRCLSGELQLPFSMKPTTVIAHFSIEYSVVLFPFDTSTFSFASEAPLAVVNVEIS